MDMACENTTEWIKVVDVARELNISTNTVRRWIADGRFEALRVGRDLRVNRKSLDDYIRKQMVN